MSKNNKAKTNRTQKKNSHTKPGKPIQISDKLNEEIPNSETISESWLERFVKLRFHWILLMMALIYAGSRYSLYTNFKDSLLYDQYLGTETDNYFFLDWAKKLPQDWLQDRPVHPYHSWHLDFANDYFKRHPKEALTYELAAKSSSDSIVAGQLLWNKWYKEKVFHQEPLYPYLLAFFIELGLDPVHTMLTLQLLLGIAGGILLMLVTKSNFGYSASLFSGLIYLFCGILLYNELILLRTSWSVFLTILLVYILDRILKFNTPKIYFIAGTVFGFAYLMQSTFVLFLLISFALAFYLNGKQYRLVFKKLSMCFLGFLLLISPVLIRNLYVGCPLFSMSSVGPVTFIVPNANPSVSYASWYPQASLHAPLLEQGYNSMGDAIRVTLGTHTGIGSIIDLLYQKLRTLWMGYEYPNNENFYLYKENFKSLQSYLFDFFIIAPLALAGLILSVFRRKSAYSLYVAIIFHLFIMLGFYVLARFRAPLAMVAIPFVAYLISELVQISKKRTKYSLVLMVLTGFCLFLSFKNYSKAQEDKFLSGESYRGVYMISLKSKLDDLSTKNEWDKWLVTQEQIFQLEPQFIQDIENEEVRTGSERVSIASFFAEMHQNRKNILDKTGDLLAARKEEKKIRSLNTFIVNSVRLMEKYGVNSEDQMKAIKSYANTYYTQKNYAEAINAYAKILVISPNDSDALNKMGLCYLEKGSYDSSKVYYRRLLEIDPKNTNALLGISGALFFTKNYNEAIYHTKKAVELIPLDGQLYANIGACYMNTGKIDSAIIWLRRGIKTKPIPRSYEYLSNCFMAVGKKDSAQIMLSKAKEELH
jgi:tetratricopeptide (TPR) repeat protein